MTIKQFIEEATRIGHSGAYISAQAEGTRFATDGRIQLLYKIWCDRCNKHTGDHSSPQDALKEFEEMHGKPNGQDMVLTEETHEN